MRISYLHSVWRGRHSARSIPVFFEILVTLLIILSLVVVQVEGVLIDKVSYTVSGIQGEVGTTNGLPGKSILTNPSALCALPRSAYSPDEQIGAYRDWLLIGSKNAFRTFSPRWETGFWFGKVPATGVPSTGPIESVSLVNPYACETIPGQDVTFFVQSDGLLYRIADSVITSFMVNSPLSLVDLAFYDSKIYALSLAQELYVCSLNTNYEVSSCSQIFLQGIEVNPVDQVGITVSADGVFVATGKLLRLFSFTGASITSLSLSAVDVHIMQLTGDIIAATQRGIFSIEVQGSTLTPTLLAGTTDTSPTNCGTSADYDATVSFCEIYRIFPISYSSIFVSTPKLSTLRLLSYPDVVVVVQFHIPFPFNMSEAQSATSNIDDNIDAALQLVLEENGVLNHEYFKVNRSSTVVFMGETSWLTNISVLVPQQQYTGFTIDTVIQSGDYTQAVDTVNEYYDLTSFFAFTDSILIDMCNASTAFVASNATAEAARHSLDYPLIYSSLPTFNNPSNAPYMLEMKLFLPAVFGDTSALLPINSTTRPLLDKTYFTEAILKNMQEAYGPDMSGTLNFPEDTFHISEFGVDDQQKIRLCLRDILTERMKVCAIKKTFGFQTEGVAIEDEIKTSSDEAWNVVGPWANRACTNEIGISNRTLASGNAKPATEYSVFIPDIYGQLDVQSCIDDTDWSDFEDWLKNLKTNSGKCGKGCIIAIAILAALLLILLILLLVVCISKRRRLAVVAAPDPPLPKPGFVSTVDDYGDSSVGTPRVLDNPLAGSTQQAENQSGRNLI